jgi:hypothetical protein
MRKLASKFLKRDATIVLKGRQRIDRWIYEAQEDRLITYPVGAAALSPAARRSRESVRYSEMLSIDELDGKPSDSPAMAIEALQTPVTA